jgi:hypothetical protein
MVSGSLRLLPPLKLVRVFIYAGFIFIICGLFGKVGAIFTMLPDPVLGGTVVLIGARTHNIPHHTRGDDTTHYTNDVVLIHDDNLLH